MIITQEFKYAIEISHKSEHQSTIIVHHHTENGHRRISVNQSEDIVEAFIVI